MSAFLDTFFEDSQPVTAVDTKDRTPSREGFAPLAQLKAWHREGTEYFKTYAPQAEEAENAVFGEQWSEAETAYLKKQGRLDLVFNHIQKNVLAVDGYRSENKLEVTYLPKEQSDTDEAEIYTQLAKHYMDACAAEYEIDRVKLQQYIGPLGVMYCGYERDDPAAEPFKAEYVDWREMRIDPKGKRYDNRDWRYCSRERWYELSEAKARWPEHAEALEQYATRGRSANETREDVDYGGDPYSPQNTTPITYLTERQDVRIIETWYRHKKQGLYIQTPTGWEVFDEANEDHQLGTLMGQEMKPGAVDCVYVSTWCGGQVLEEFKSDYDHPFFPYLFMWALKDGKGRPMGAVHAQLDPQKSHNWAMSKLLWQAASNAWLIPDGTVDDEAAFKANAARPDAMLRWSPAQDHSQKPERLEHGESRLLASELADRSLQDLSEISGAAEAFRGQQSAEVSGRAIARKQEGALRQQGLYFREEERFYYQFGVMWRSMIAAKVDNERVIRITQPNGTTAYAAINVQDPLRRAELEAQGYKVHGTITRLNYDTKVVTSPMSATVRERQAAGQAMLNDMLSPDQLAAVSDLRVLQTDIKDKEKIAERIVAQRQATMPQMGMPMGPPGPPPPEPGELGPEEPPQAPEELNEPPAQEPGGFPMDPMMADPSLMAGEMAADGGPYG